jgi:proline iminopeptidase
MKKILRIVSTIFLSLITLLVLLFVIFYLLTTGDYEVAETVQQDPSIPHIKTGSTVLHAETFGHDTSAVVIAIHGGPGNDFRYILPLKGLADEYHVVFYDQRGTGLSPRVPAEEQTLDNMYADLDDIIDHYAGGRKVNLIGHSWGAMLASGYTCRHPGKVNKLVLAEPGFLTPEGARSFMEKVKSRFSPGLLIHFGRCWFQSLHVKGPDDQAGRDYFFQSLMLGVDPRYNPYAGYYCKQDMDSGSFDFWRFGAVASTALFKSALDGDGNLQINLVKGAEHFTNKVLFIASECNSIIGEAQQRIHMQYFPHAELAVIKNAGHTMFGEKPEKCLQVIRQYFHEP